MGVEIGKRSKALPLLVIDSIPKCQFEFVAFQFDVRNINLEASRQLRRCWEKTLGKDP